MEAAEAEAPLFERASFSGIDPWPPLVVKCVSVAVDFLETMLLSLSLSLSPCHIRPFVEPFFNKSLASNKYFTLILRYSLQRDFYFGVTTLEKGLRKRDSIIRKKASAII